MVDILPMEIEDFSKSYKNFQAVSNLSLTINSGEVFGFLGPNGAGKTTTIRSILNFISPTNGKIRIFGLDSQADTVQIKNNIGYLAGDISLYDSMTPINFLKFLTSLGRQTDWGFVDSLSEKLDIPMTQQIKKLSKGNKQKVGLIQAFMHKPKLLILDEPTSALDPLMKETFYQIISDIKAEGHTVFISSHDLTEIQKICTRAGFIKNGTLMSIENMQNVKNLNVRRYTIVFKDVQDVKDFENLTTVSEVTSQDTTITCTVSGNIAEFISFISAKNPLDLYEEETDLEDIFMRFYDK